MVSYESCGIEAGLVYANSDRNLNRTHNLKLNPNPTRCLRPGLGEWQSDSEYRRELWMEQLVRRRGEVSMAK